MQTHQSVKPLGQWDRCPVFSFFNALRLYCFIPCMDSDVRWHANVEAASQECGWSKGRLAHYMLLFNRHLHPQRSTLALLCMPSMWPLCLQRRREAFDLHAIVQCLFAVGA